MLDTFRPGCRWEANDGLIAVAEYKAKKAEILARMVKTCRTCSLANE
jgi:hypothetical protein